MDQTDIDLRMMQRCIALSETATKKREFPFACVICDGDRVVAESTNLVRQDGDITRHAELVAISDAQKVLGRKRLTGCTLYSNIEPCPMCSFPIREARISRVVYAIRSPKMGGASRWNILRDSEISRVMPEAFGPVPEVISGFMGREAAKVWWTWNPIVWAIIRKRGCFAHAPETDDVETLDAIPSPHGWLRSILRLHST
jgi:tRNA(adenine34) deaminase